MILRREESGLLPAHRTSRSYTHNVGLDVGRGGEERDDLRQVCADRGLGERWVRGGQGEGYWAAPGYKGGTRKPTTSTAQALSGSRDLISVSSGGFGCLRGAPGFRDRLIGSFRLCFRL